MFDTNSRSRLSLAKTLLAGLSIVFWFDQIVIGQELGQSAKSKLEKFSNDVLAFLKQRDEKSITVGAITSERNAPIPGSSGIRAELLKSLDRLKPGSVTNNARWTIEGIVSLADDPSDSSKPEAERNLVTFIDFSLRDSRREHPLAPITVVIPKLNDTMVIVGATVETPPQADLRATLEKLRESFKKPPAVDFRFPSVARPTQESAFGLELRAKPVGAEEKPGLPIPLSVERMTGLLPETEQEFFFAPIGRNQEYEAIVYNDSEKEIAVALSIDGIDVFAFSEDVDPQTKESKFSHFIVAAKSQLLIPGWHRTIGSQRQDNFLAFLVTEYGRGAQANRFPNQPRPDSVGAVTATFSECFEIGDIKSGGSATGFGKPIKQDQKPVQRQIAKPHASITVRYTRS